MIEKRVVNFIGNPGSGKSQLCAHAAEKWGSEIIRPSGIIAAYAAANNIRLDSRKDFMACRDGMAAEDESVFVAPVLESKSKNIVIDGLRVPADIDKLRGAKLINRMVVIALHCSIEERFAGVMEHRLERSGRDRLSIEAFRVDEAGDYFSNDRNSGSVQTVMQEADYHVQSTPCDIPNLIRMVDPILADVFTS